MRKGTWGRGAWRRLAASSLCAVLASCGVAAGGDDTGAAESEALGGGGGGGGACSYHAFGLAQRFNVFLMGNLVSNGSDIGGSAAAGGSIALSGYAVGGMLPPDPHRPDLIAGGSLAFSNGAVPAGAVVYGGTFAGSGYYFLAGPVLNPAALPFFSIWSGLQALSSSLGALPPNGTTGVVYNAGRAQITLTGTSPGLNVFRVNATDLAHAASLGISAPAGATVVVNVAGPWVTMQNFGIFFTGGADRAHTLFNFPNATAVHFEAIAIEGTVLAPNAAVDFPQGQFNGQLFARSFKGRGQFAWFPFKGCLPLPGGCGDTSSDPLNCGACGHACHAGQVCVQGQCSWHCPPGQTNCSGRCVNLSNDPHNCGACGNACGYGQSCQSGHCVPQCPPGQILCAGHCVDPLSDEQNCGGCGCACDPGELCQGGHCVPQCPPGLILCGGHCVDPLSDEANCGGCGIVCDQGELCQGGHCVPQCPPGEILCGGHCVDPLTDEANCGGCGNVCDQGDLCQEGECVSQCLPPLLECFGDCIDPNTDENNCGECGHVCPAGQVCDEGGCVVVCEPPLTQCDGLCVDLDTNADHCGGCFNDCGGNLGCAAGVCTCAPGTTLCDGWCADLQSDPNNCGACGHACGAGRGCQAGVCVPDLCGALGEAAPFTVFGMPDGIVDLIEGFVAGDVGVSLDGSLFIRGLMSVEGDVLVNTGAVVSENSGTVSGTVLLNQDLAGAWNDALNASASFAALTPTATYPSWTGSMTVTGNGGVNVIQVGNVMLPAGSMVTLAGGPSDVFIVNVPGSFLMGFGAGIYAGPGVDPDQIIFNITGGGSIVQLAPGTEFTGSILAPARAGALSGAVVGNLIFGNIRLGLESPGVVDGVCPYP